MKVNKIVCILIILTILFIAIIPKQEIASGLFDISDLGELGQYEGNGGTATEFDRIINQVVSLLQVIGSIISVIVLIVVGIKYMFASIEERASYKTTMMPYLIGALMLFGISNVTGLLYYLAKNIF